MREWHDKGIILKLGHFGESHIWLKVLFENRGIQTVFAFGGAISRKRFCGCLDTLNLLDCLVRPTRNGDYLVLQEVTLLGLPRLLRKNWRATGLINNCLRFLDILPVPPESGRESFAVISDLVGWLEKANNPPWHIPQFFRLRIGSALGYSPNFRTCGDCGKVLESGVFLADDGRTYCPDCAKAKTFQEKKHSFFLSSQSLSLLGHACILPLSQCALMAESVPDLRQCVQAIDGFVEFHLGIIWDKGSFQRI